MKDNSILAERVMTSCRRIGFHRYMQRVEGCVGKDSKSDTHNRV